MFFGMLGIYLKAVITEVALSGRLEPQSCFPKSCFDGLLSIIFNLFFFTFFHGHCWSAYRAKSSAHFGLAEGMDRSKKIQLLAEALFEGFIKDDGGQYLALTGEIAQADNLRAYKTRKAFDLVMAACENCQEKRFWTKASIKDAIAKMMKDRALEIPRTSGFVWTEWLKQQVDRIHDLSQRARKKSWKMDYMTTLPYDPTADTFQDRDLHIKNKRSKSFPTIHRNMKKTF